MINYKLSLLKRTDVYWLILTKTYYAAKYPLRAGNMRRVAVTNREKVRLYTIIKSRPAASFHGGYGGFAGGQAFETPTNFLVKILDSFFSIFLALSWDKHL